MTDADSTLSRRALLSAAGLALLGGCSDGGEDAPAIDRFTAEAAFQFLGERARLLVRFSGGRGRIEPDIGAVESGVPVDTPALAATRRYTLLVEAPGHTTVRKELEVAVVNYRNRYLQLHQSQVVAEHAAVLMGSGSVLILGGSRWQNILSDAIERFDPATGNVSRVGTLGSGRASHTATRVGESRVLVLGGNTTVPQYGAELVNERSGNSLYLGRTARDRVGHAAVSLADERVLIVGGTANLDVEYWEPSSGAFRLLATRLRHGRECPTATLLRNGCVLVAGGYSAASNYVFAEIFDPVSESFTPVPSDNQDRRMLHQAHALNDGSVLIAGGEVADGNTMKPLVSVLRYDPASGRITTLHNLDSARSLVQGVATPGGELLLFGGESAFGQATASASAWHRDGARAAAPMPGRRVRHTATLLDDGRVLIVGGSDGNDNPVPTAYLYD